MGCTGGVCKFGKRSKHDLARSRYKDTSHTPGVEDILDRHIKGVRRKLQTPNATRDICWYIFLQRHHARHTSGVCDGDTLGSTCRTARPNQICHVTGGCSLLRHIHVDGVEGLVGKWTDINHIDAEGNRIFWLRTVRTRNKKHSGTGTRNEVVAPLCRGESINGAPGATSLENTKNGDIQGRTFLNADGDGAVCERSIHIHQVLSKGRRSRIQLAVCPGNIERAVFIFEVTLEDQSQVIRARSGMILKLRMNQTGLGSLRDHRVWVGSRFQTKFGTGRSAEEILFGVVEDECNDVIHLL